MATKKPNQGDEHVKPSGAEGHTNDAALKKFNEIRDLLAEAEHGDVLARYKVACAIREVRDAGTYGAGAMKKLVEVLGKSESWVNDYATLAATWPDADKFAVLAAKKNKKGIPLTWSHFIELMRVEDKDRRQTLMEQSLKEGWSVADLEAKRKTPPASPAGSDTTNDAEIGVDTAGSVAAPVPSNTVKAAVNGVKEDLSAAKAKLQEKLPKMIKDAPEDQLDEALASLQEAREQFADLHKTTLESIDLAIAQVEERRKLAAKKKDKPGGKKKAAPAGDGVATVIPKKPAA